VAFCTACGTELNGSGTYCASCGALIGASVQASAARGRRPKTLWIAGAALLVCGAIAVAFLTSRGAPVSGMLGGDDDRGRVLAAESALSAMLTGDAQAIRAVSSSRSGSALARLAQAPVAVAPVARWDGEVRVLESSRGTFRLTADGDSVLAESGTASVRFDMVAEDGRWVVDDVLNQEGGTWVSYGAQSSGGQSSSGQSSDGQPVTREKAMERACFSNQRVVMGAAQQYVAVNGDRAMAELVGSVRSGHPLIGPDSFIREVPVCALGDSPYVLDDSGTTTCPYGSSGNGHGSFQ
jgi:hypothetical protein